MGRVVRKPAFCICKNKDAVAAKLISAFVFATRIVQSLYFLNPKFQASSHLLWLYSPLCVGHGRKPRRPVFSQRGSYAMLVLFLQCNELKFIQNVVFHSFAPVQQDYCTVLKTITVMILSFSTQALTNSAD